ncbi:type II toxin-antitoxin system RelE family toxin [Wolbachia endosymbiont (group A) of Cheilosia soror]|uniref:type II toxin-antitoxin system RelE family toxin n=1 Tax=Wolbachia endosymbiont (group A) of Cheilosia soror TaxID=2953995 RepID=UPI0021F8FAE6|nr:type II toxin-antitoxin system RelE/ParE family toxin [Wolbachia endosymbiont (group A) of Cheilosia soror]
MGYTIIFLDNVLEKDLPDLPKTVRLRVINAINERLTVDSINLGEPLHHSLKGRRRLRVGDYRVIYRVNQSEHIVVITEIGHRDNIYKR